MKSKPFYVIGKIHKGRLVRSSLLGIYPTLLAALDLAAEFNNNYAHIMEIRKGPYKVVEVSSEILKVIEPPSEKL